MSEAAGGLSVKGYLISDQFFSTGFRFASGPCRCSSACCEGGVWVDIREREMILAHRGVIKKYLDQTQMPDERLWFNDDELNDRDFPSGRCVSTREHNGKCAFLDGLGRCSLQLTATSEGMHRWALKPQFCILFPVEISDGVVSFDDMLQGEQSCCTVDRQFETPLFEGCKDELVRLLGDDGYQEMEQHYAALRSPVHEVKVGR